MNIKIKYICKYTSKGKYTCQLMLGQPLEPNALTLLLHKNATIFRYRSLGSKWFDKILVMGLIFGAISGSMGVLVGGLVGSTCGIGGGGGG